jgi:hypothetical protein
VCGIELNRASDGGQGGIFTMGGLDTAAYDEFSNSPNHRDPLSHRWSTVSQGASQLCRFQPLHHEIAHLGPFP